MSSLNARMSSLSSLASSPSSSSIELSDSISNILQDYVIRKELNDVINAADDNRLAILDLKNTVDNLRPSEEEYLDLESRVATLEDKVDTMSSDQKAIVQAQLELSDSMTRQKEELTAMSIMLDMTKANVNSMAQSMKETIPSLFLATEAQKRAIERQKLMTNEILGMIQPIPSSEFKSLQDILAFVQKTYATKGDADALDKNIKEVEAMLQMLKDSDEIENIQGMIQAIKDTYVNQTLQIEQNKMIIQLGLMIETVSDELSQSIHVLENGGNATRARVEANEQAIADTMDMVTDIKETYAPISAVEEISTKVDNIKLVQDNLTSNVNGLSETMMNQDAKDMALMEQYNDMLEKLAMVRFEVQEVSSKAADATELQDVIKSLSDLMSVSEQHNESIAVLDKMLLRLKDEVTFIEHHYAVDEELREIQAEILKEISDNVRAADELAAKVDTIDTTLTAHITDTSIHTPRDMLQSGIAEVTSLIDRLQTEVIDNRRSITTLGEGFKMFQDDEIINLQEMVDAIKESYVNETVQMAQAAQIENINAALGQMNIDFNNSVRALEDKDTTLMDNQREILDGISQLTSENIARNEELTEEIKQAKESLMQQFSSDLTVVAASVDMSISQVKDSIESLSDKDMLVMRDIQDHENDIETLRQNLTNIAQNYAPQESVTSLQQMSGEMKAQIQELFGDLQKQMMFAQHLEDGLREHVQDVSIHTPSHALDLGIAQVTDLIDRLTQNVEDNHKSLKSLGDALKILQEDDQIANLQEMIALIKESYVNETVQMMQAAQIKNISTVLDSVNSQFSESVRALEEKDMTVMDDLTKLSDNINQLSAETFTSDRELRDEMTAVNETIFNFLNKSLEHLGQKDVLLMEAVVEQGVISANLGNDLRENYVAQTDFDRLNNTVIALSEESVSQQSDISQVMSQIEVIDTMLAMVKNTYVTRTDFDANISSIESVLADITDQVLPELDSTVARLLAETMDLMTNLTMLRQSDIETRNTLTSLTQSLAQVTSLTIPELHNELISLKDVDAKLQKDWTELKAKDSTLMDQLSSLMTMTARLNDGLSVLDQDFRGNVTDINEKIAMLVDVDQLENLMKQIEALLETFVNQTHFAEQVQGIQALKASLGDVQNALFSSVGKLEDADIQTNNAVIENKATIESIQTMLAMVKESYVNNSVLDNVVDSIKGDLITVETHVREINATVREELNEDILSLQGQQGEIKTEVQAQSAKDNQLMDQATRLSAVVSQLEEDLGMVISANLSDIREEMDLFKGKQENIQVMIDDLSSKDMILMDQAGKLDTELADLAQVVAGIGEDDIKELRDQVNSLQQSSGVANTQLVNQFEQVLQISEDVVRLSEGLDDLSSSLNSLQDQANTTDGRVENLALNLTGLAERSAVISQDVSSNEDSIKQLQDMMAMVKQDVGQIEGLETMLNMVKQDYVGLDRYNNLLSLVQNHDQLLQSHEDSIGGIENNFVTIDQHNTLQGKVNNSEAALSELSTQLSGVNTTVDMVVTNYVDKASLDQALSESEAGLSALSAGVDSLKAFQVTYEEYMDSLCGTVTNITRITGPVHSSTRRRWFMEKLKAVKNPTCGLPPVEEGDSDYFYDDVALG